MKVMTSLVDDPPERTLTGHTRVLQHVQRMQTRMNCLSVKLHLLIIKTLDLPSGVSRKVSLFYISVAFRSVVRVFAGV